MKTNSYQVGVGLMEILVALLVLALGILGFIALQYRAVEATAEGGTRVQAINLSRDFAERIRVNRGALSDYESELKSSSGQGSSKQDCAKQYCSAQEIADYDVSQVVAKAHSVAMTINLDKCQGNQDERKCIYVAWGETAATNGASSGTGNCTVGTAYDPASTCLVMEVY